MRSSCLIDGRQEEGVEMTSEIRVADGLSIVRGIPLAEEEGNGALTLSGYVREVTERFGPNEMGCMRDAAGTGMIRWSYDDLWAKSMEVARALTACGTGKGTRIATMTTNRLEFFSGFFGAALAGGIATPLSTFSTAAELEEILKKGAVSVLLFERHVLKKDFAQILVELEPRIATAAPGELKSEKFPYLRHIAMVDSEEGFGAIEGWSAFRARGAEIEPELVEARAAQVSPADPGALFFSSGSTGKAKGILTSHRAVTLQLWRWPRWYRLRHDKIRTWTANGFFWSGNFAMTLGSTLSTGGALVLQPTFQAEDALRLMEQERVSKLIAWPHQWAQLEAAPNFLETDLSSMIYVPYDTPVGKHPTVKSEWLDNRAAYGNTETFTLITVYPSLTPFEVARDSHGIPTPGSTIKIVDPLTGETMPLGERGEIAVKGPTVMLGYLGVPLDETLDEDGFLRTNDGGYMDEEGRLFWEGRLNDIIKTGGANVSPIEIDNVIRECPGVKLSQTVGVPDELLGELVVACIVPHEGVKLDEETVRGFAKEKLASYKVPRRVLFFEEHELETTGSAKVKTAELRKLASDRLEAETAPAG
jgi:fatty-acyl-CoA synthase